MNVRLNLLNSVLHWSRYTPSHPAVSGSIDVISYRELDRRSAYLASILSKHAAAGDRVGLCIQSSASYWVGLLAIMRVGCVPAIVHPRLDDPIIQEILLECDSRLLLTDGHVGAINGVHIIRLFAYHGANAWPTDYASPSSQSTSAHSLSALWAIVYTSGTTKRPKGVVRTNMSALFEMLAWSIELPFCRGQSMYIGRPLAYVAGTMLSATALLVGGSIVAPETHSNEGLVHISRKTLLDCAYLFPNQVASLLDYCVINRLSVTGLRRILTMGARIDASIKVQAARQLNLTFIESWGNSEGLGTITDPSDIEDRPSSVGRPFLTDDVRVLREDLTPCAPFEIGRIHARTDSAMSGYQGRGGIDASMLIGDLVASDDDGYLDENGYLYLKGRTAERIVIGSQVAYGSDFEPILLAHSGIKDAKVVYLASTSEVVAAVEVESGHFVDPSEILIQTNEKLSAGLRLDRIVVIEQLPRNVGGKIIISAVINSIEMTTT
jgi:acyl-CoA synthetase (AMP-forming)/AMP-acid ligase II